MNAYSPYNMRRLMDNLRMGSYNRVMYLHERENWAEFTWDDRVITPLVGNARFAQGKLLGRLEDVGFDLSCEIEVDSLSDEVVASSRIEGVQLDAAMVRSSMPNSSRTSAMMRCAVPWPQPGQ